MHGCINNEGGVHVKSHVVTNENRVDQLRKYSWHILNESVMREGLPLNFRTASGRPRFSQVSQNPIALKETPER